MLGIALKDLILVDILKLHVLRLSARIISCELRQPTILVF